MNCFKHAVTSRLADKDRRAHMNNIAKNQGHFEPANNYQRYIVLHSGTVEYQEKSIWRQSRLDLQRSVFRTMTYTI